ncbi:MAG TPA: hypothetical protein VJY35_11120 [Candidatus Eisenbacteria bacterium]|nr:hypothetical protein [Candidatus Eisenbacteria bacterium]
MSALPDFMYHLKSAPSWPLLAGCVARLEAAGVPVALGGSGLLAALGLADTVGDWDLTTDAPWERVDAALADEPHTDHGNDALHADHKRVIADGAIEVIVGFAYFTPSGVVRIPTIVSGHAGRVPLGSPECWAVAYALLGRPAKSETLFSHLESRGAEPAAMRRLLAEPLPEYLAARLTALPHFK